MQCKTRNNTICTSWSVSQSADLQSLKLQFYRSFMVFFKYFIEDLKQALIVKTYIHDDFSEICYKTVTLEKFS